MRRQIPINRQDPMINLFVQKEAEASVSLSNDPEMQTMVLGSTNNPKLYDIIVTIKDRKSNKIVWRGPVARLANEFVRK